MTRSSKTGGYAAAFGGDAAQRAKFRSARLWVWPALTWLVVIVTSPLLMMPNSDDPYYFMPALGFLREGLLVVPAGELSERIFFNFPTYSFLQGLFLLAVDAIGIPVNFYTHRLFHGIIVVALLALSLYYIRLLAQRDGRSAGQAGLVFLVLLGATPFGQTWVLVRPEPLGLLFVVGSLITYHRWTSTGRTRAALFYGSGVLLGVPLTTHPLFVPVCGMVLVGILYLEWKKRESLGRLAGFIVAGALPTVPMVAYYLAYSPDSFAQVFGQEAGLAPAFFAGFGGLIGRSFPISADDSLIRRAVSALFFVPLLTLLLAGSAGSLVRSRIFRGDDQRPTLPLLFLFLSIALILAIPLNFIYIFGLVGFLGSLFVAAILGPQIASAVLRGLGSRAWIVALVSIAAAGLWSEIHVAKFLLFPDRFLRPDRVLTIARAAQGTGARLFISAEELVPLFLDNLDATVRDGDRAPLPTYWLFPSSGRFQKGPHEAERLRAYLDQMLAANTGQDLWFVNLANFDPADMNACVAIPRIPFKVGLKVSGVVYRDHRYILLRSSSQNVDCALAARPAADGQPPVEAARP